MYLSKLDSPVPRHLKNGIPPLYLTQTSPKAFGNMHGEGLSLILIRVNPRHLRCLCSILYVGDPYIEFTLN